MIESFEKLNPAKKSEIKQLTLQIERKLSDIETLGTLNKTQAVYLFTSNTLKDKHVVLKALQHLIEEWQVTHLPDNNPFESNLRKVHQALIDHPRYTNGSAFSFFDTTTKDLVHSVLRLLPGLPQKQAAPLDIAAFHEIEDDSVEDQYFIDAQGPVKKW